MVKRLCAITSKYNQIATKGVNMGKVKEQQIRDEELRQEYMLSYGNWIDMYKNEPRLDENDTNILEEESSSPKTSNKIVSTKPLNNQNYNQQGA
jgi:hypothetical protein